MMKRRWFLQLILGAAVLPGRSGACMPYSREMKRLRIQLIRSQTLPDFPSGSGICWQDGRLCLVGDDAREIVVLDAAYRELGRRILFPGAPVRTPKPLKADIEAVAAVSYKGKPYLLAAGSASTDVRMQLLLVPFEGGEPQKFSYTPSIIEAVRKQAGAINFEGCTDVLGRIVLANRGNATFPVNHLVLPEGWPWEPGIPHILPLEFPGEPGAFAGVSDIYYEPRRDVLMLTFSTEATASAYDDGAIGDSWLALIERFAGRMRGNEPLRPDAWVNLSATIAAFKGEKVEGVCVEQTEERGWVLHLVSDNDAGQSRLFCLRVEWAV
ncbi:DUF6929 family protein [Chitinophaga lutea]